MVSSRYSWHLFSSEGTPVLGRRIPAQHHRQRRAQPRLSLRLRHLEPRASNSAGCEDSSSPEGWQTGSCRQECQSDAYAREDGRLETLGFGEGGRRLPSQGELVVRGVEPIGLQLQERDRPPDVDFLSELIAIQQNGPKNLGFFGTRNMGFLHQNLIEVLSYAMVLTGNHIFTSGATGTNAAVIRGALRAEDPELLTVVLPQSLQKQPPESQDLLSQVKAENLIAMPQNDDLSLSAASRLCNRDIVNRVQQVICFAFHDSNLLLETCEEAKDLRKIVTLFYLD